VAELSSRPAVHLTWHYVPVADFIYLPAKDFGAFYRSCRRLGGRLVSKIRAMGTIVASKACGRRPRLILAEHLHGRARS
jgi:hypothetical protein